MPLHSFFCSFESFYLQLSRITVTYTTTYSLKFHSSGSACAHIKIPVPSVRVAHFRHFVRTLCIFPDEICVMISRLVVPWAGQRWVTTTTSFLHTIRHTDWTFYRSMVKNQVKFTSYYMLGTHDSFTKS